MEPGIPSLIADQMRVHLKTGSSWYIYIYIKLESCCIRSPETKNQKRIRHWKDMPRSIRGLDVNETGISL